MTGGDAIAMGLRAHGVDTVFGIPGAQLYGLFDAFARTEMRVIGARHEQGCAYMAFGAARSTGRPGVFAVVPGPGVLNTAAALLTALGSNARVFGVTGEVPTRFLGLGRGHLHEMPDQLATLRSIVKHAKLIEHPALAPRTIAHAFQTMRSGRPGPSVVWMPWDQFTTSAPVQACDTLPLDLAPEPDPDDIARAAKLIAGASTPMILVGGGAVDATEEVRVLAERLGAPVVSFRSGRGVLSDAHPQSLTCAAGSRLWGGTDLVIGIGSRMELAGWRWPARIVPSIRIDIDPAEMRRSHPSVAILADAAAGIKALLGAVWSERTDQSDRIAGAKQSAAQDIQCVQPQMAYLEAIRDVLPQDGFLVDEMVQAGFTSWFGFPVDRPRCLITSGYQGTLGYGFPTALGVKVANPDKSVVSITGDGGFMFSVQELATAVQYGIGVVVIVFNNGAFGNVRRDQLKGFGGRVVGADLVNPDFVRLAESFGLPGRRVRSPAELRPVLEAALAAAGPALIEVEITPDSEASPWEFIQPGLT